MKTNNFRKRLAQVDVKMFEFGARELDNFALPVGRKHQEKLIHKLYNNANKAAKLGGLQQKTYKRINSKGTLEEVT